MTDFDQYQEWVKILPESIHTPYKGLEDLFNQNTPLTQEGRYALANELGTILYNIAHISNKLNIPLSVIATQNRINLTKRITSNNLKGERDE